MAIPQSSPDTPDKVSEDASDVGILKKWVFPTLILLGFKLLFDKGISKKLVYYSVLLSFALLYDREKRKEQEREIPFDKLPEEVRNTMMSDDISTFELGEGEERQTDKGTRIMRENDTIHIQ